MSLKALSWAIEASIGKKLSANSKLVLWQIADAHNIENGAFLQQETIAAGAEVHRATVNRCIDDLVKAGLVTRKRRVDRTTGKQLSTRYSLAFEAGFEPQHVVDRVADCDTASTGPTGERGDEQDVENWPDRVAKQPTAVSHPDATQTLREPITPLPPETDLFPDLVDKWPAEKLGAVDRARSAYDALTRAERTAAVALVDAYRAGCYGLGRELPRLSTYLQERAFEEFEGAPPIERGYFRITTPCPEWTAWLKWIEAQHGAAARARTEASGFFLTKTRRPTEHRSRSAA